MVGAKDDSKCVPCPPGHFCDTEAADSVDVTTAYGSAGSQKCDPGYYCKLGSYTATPGVGSDPPGILYNDYGGQC